MGMLDYCSWNLNSPIARGHYLDRASSRGKRSSLRVPMILGFVAAARCTNSEPRDKLDEWLVRTLNEPVAPADLGLAMNQSEPTGLAAVDIDGFELLDLIARGGVAGAS